MSGLKTAHEDFCVVLGEEKLFFGIDWAESIAVSRRLIKTATEHPTSSFCPAFYIDASLEIGTPTNRSCLMSSQDIGNALAFIDNLNEQINELCEGSKILDKRILPGHLLEEFSGYYYNYDLDSGIKIPEELSDMYSRYSICASGYGLLFAYSAHDACYYEAVAFSVREPESGKNKIFKGNINPISLTADLSDVKEKIEAAAAAMLAAQH